MQSERRGVTVKRWHRLELAEMTEPSTVLRFSGMTAASCPGLVRWVNLDQTQTTLKEERTRRESAHPQTCDLMVAVRVSRAPCL